MTDGVTIYHNPRCTTSRKTLDLLRDNGIEPTVVQYLKTPPTRAELVKMIKDAGIDVRTAVRKREALYDELGSPRPTTTNCSTRWPSTRSSSSAHSSSPPRAPGWPGRSTRFARFCECGSCAAAATLVVLATSGCGAETA